MPGKHAPLEVRFWGKVLKAGPDDCWLWTAGTNGVGYGMIGRGSAESGRCLAHRLSFELHNGPIPHGAVICHRCDNPACVNPAHLFAGSMSDNTQDMLAKGRARCGRIPRERQWSFLHPERIKRGDNHPQRIDPTKVLRGERNGNAKLTAELVRRYRSELAAGKPITQLAREAGVDKKTLATMRDRVTWRHVP